MNRRPKTFSELAGAIMLTLMLVIASAFTVTTLILAIKFAFWVWTLN